MRRVALERAYLEQKLARDAHWSSVIQELRREVALLPEEGTADLQLRDEYLTFVAQRRDAIEALLKGGSADPSQREPVSKLRVALGGLTYLASCKTREAVVEFGAAYSLLSLPYIALQVIFEVRPALCQRVQHSVAAGLKGELPFSYKCRSGRKVRGPK